MSVDNLTTKVVNYTDGLTTEFSFPFKIFSASEVQVLMLPEPTTVEPYPTPIELILNADYTVAFNSELESGTVTTPYAWEAGYKIVIKRLQVIDQQEDISQQERFKLHDLEHALDKLTLIVQNLDTEIQRTAKLTEDFQYPVTLPSPEANKFLAWHSTQRGQLVNRETTVDLTNYYTIPEVDLLILPLEEGINDLDILVQDLTERLDELDASQVLIPDSSPLYLDYMNTLEALEAYQVMIAGKADTVHTHDLSALNQSGASNGQVATYNGSAWVPANPVEGVNDGENVGLGVGVFKEVSGDKFQYKGLYPISPVQARDFGDDILLGIKLDDLTEGDLLVANKIATIGVVELASNSVSESWLITGDGNGNLVGVAFGSAQTIRSSDNGVTWIAGGSLPSQQWRRPAYGEGVFVVCSGNGSSKRVYRSTDNGATWTAATYSGSTSNWQSIIFLVDRFILAASGSSDVLYSVDLGDTFTLKSLGTGSSQTGIAKISDTEFFVGTYTEITYVFDYNFNRVASSLAPAPVSTYYLTGGSGAIVGTFGGTTWVSYDKGMSWIDMGPKLPFSATSAVMFGNGMFIALSQSDPDVRAVLSTDNGRSWMPIMDSSEPDWVQVRYSHNGRFILTRSIGGTDIGYIDIDYTLKLGSVDKSSIPRSPIKCIATQRSFKTTSGGGTIVASDAQYLIANTSMQRRLNHMVCNEASKEFFSLVSPDSSNASVRVKKAGRYKLTATQTARRTGYYDSWMSWNDGPSSRASTGHTATGATAAANCAHQVWSVVAELKADSYITLQAYYATNSANECFGLFWTQGSDMAPYNYNDTCSIEIEFIGL